MRIKGIKKARAKNKARVRALDVGIANAISQTVDEVHKAGLHNIDAMTRKQSGRLRKFYQKALRSKGQRGLVGYVTKSARKRAFYARWVHDGTSRQKARPFHDNAVLGVEGKHAGRMKAALARALSGKASPSGLARTGGGLEKDIGNE